MELRTARDLATQLMTAHDLTRQGWRFSFDNAIRRAGVCFYSRRLIRLSRHFVGLNSEEEIRDTILHEIAHAIAGHAAGHGPAWKAVCRRIGAKPERCYDSKTVAMPPARYRAFCPSCRKEYRRNKVGTRNGRYYYCPRCGKDHGRLTFQRAPVEQPARSVRPVVTESLYE